MSREAHVRFWERVGVRFPCATRHVLVDTLGLVLHALVYGTFVVVGLFFTWRGGYRLSDLSPGSPSAVGPPVAPAPELVSAGATRDRSI